MAARDGVTSELQRTLRELFPDSDVILRSQPTDGMSVRADARVEVDGTQFLIEMLGSLSNAQLVDASRLLQLQNNASRSGIPVLAAPYFSPAKQELLRKAGASFLDYAGNAWIVAPGIHIDRRGFHNPVKERRDQRDLFSDKASLVLRTLLAARAPIGIRQIADIVSSSPGQIRLSPGYVSKVVQELERQGYAARRDEKVVARHAKELLNDWVVSYRNRRRPSSKSYFVSSSDAETLIPGLAHALAEHNVDYVFTGHAGASLVDRYAHFDVVDVYVKEPEDADIALSSMGARRVDRGGNISVSRPYYRESAFYEARLLAGSVVVASDIQLYLDLYDYPVRGREQAEHLYERRLQTLIERDGEL